MSKWTKAKLETIALKYNTRNEFKKNDSAAYAASRRLKVLDDICKHMNSPIKIWTEKEIQERANLYTTINDFKNNDNQAYQSSKRKKIFDKVTSHMIKQKESWNKEKIHNLALNYDRRIDFMNNEPKAYGAARRLKILNFVCSHMEQTFIEWSETKLNRHAKKYSYRNEFKRKDNSAYQAAIRMGIIDKICNHMDKGVTGFDKNKSAIAYYIKVEKDGDTVFKIGITNNSVKDRFREELKYIEILHIWEFEIGQKAFDFEQEIINDYSYAKYKGSNILKSGNTEMFIDDILMLDKQIA